LVILEPRILYGEREEVDFDSGISALPLGAAEVRTARRRP